MMLEWSAGQVTEITQELTDLEFWPTLTNVERGVRNLEFVLQCTQDLRPVMQFVDSFDETVTLSPCSKAARWAHHSVGGARRPRMMNRVVVQTWIWKMLRRASGFKGI